MSEKIQLDNELAKIFKTAISEKIEAYKKKWNRNPNIIIMYHSLYYRLSYLRDFFDKYVKNGDKIRPTMFGLEVIWSFAFISEYTNANAFNPNIYFKLY